MSGAERTRTINPFFHPRIAWCTAAEVWGSDDYRATPLETLDKRQGDCEDCAIAKYASLLAVGTAPDRLRLVSVRAKMPQVAAAQAHRVLVCCAEPLILDNLRPEVLPGPWPGPTARRRTRTQP